MSIVDSSRPAQVVPDPPDFPPFEPHPMLRGGHLQTLAGHFMPKPPIRLGAIRSEVDLDDGDRIFVLESAPPGCPRDRPVVLVVHGLVGSAESDYQVRFADRLVRLGLRTLRVNLRSAGSGLGLARGIYHGGRTEDVRTVVDWVVRRYPDAPIALVGFSLGGNLVLKLAAEAARRSLPNLDCVLAANPPIDLSVCCRGMRRFPHRLYDRFFVRQLRSDIRRLHDLFPDLGPVDLSRVRSMYEFDECYTAPRSGFTGAEDYYRRSSAGPLIPDIQVPGLVVHALDDPFIPADPFFLVDFPSQIRLEVADTGGHLGYVSRRRVGGDRRWLDARLSSWLAMRWGLSPDSPAPRDGWPLPTTVPTGSQPVSCPIPASSHPTSSAPPSMS